MQLMPEQTPMGGFFQSALAAPKAPIEASEHKPTKGKL